MDIFGSKSLWICSRADVQPFEDGLALVWFAQLTEILGRRYPGSSDRQLSVCIFGSSSVKVCVCRWIGSATHCGYERVKLLESPMARKYFHYYCLRYGTVQRAETSSEQRAKVPKQQWAKDPAEKSAETPVEQLTETFAECLAEASSEEPSEASAE